MDNRRWVTPGETETESRTANLCAYLVLSTSNRGYIVREDDECVGRSSPDTSLSDVAVKVRILHHRNLKRVDGRAHRLN